jgi:hypothetical protein
MSESLRDTLNRLRRELARAGTVDSDLRAELERTIDEMHEVAERGVPESAQSLAEQLEALGVRFEQEHPSLTEAIHRVVSVLGAMGI